MEKKKSFISNATKFEKLNVILLVVVVLYIAFANSRFFEISEKNYSFYELFDLNHNYYMYNEKVYYAKDNILYSCDFEGNNKKIEGKLSYDDNKIIYVYDNKLFYSSTVKGAGTACFDLKAKKDKQIDTFRTTDEDKMDNIITVRNKVYYINDKNEYKCFDLKKNKVSDIGYGTGKGHMYVDDKDEVYIINDGIVKKDNKEILSLNDEEIKCIKICNNKMYVFATKAVYIYGLDNMKLEDEIAANGYAFTYCLDDGNVYGVINGYPRLYIFDFDENKIKVKMDIKEASSVKNSVEINNISTNEDTIILNIRESFNDDNITIYENEEVKRSVTIDSKYLFVDKENKGIYYYRGNGKIINSIKY